METSQMKGTEKAESTEEGQSKDTAVNDLDLNYNMSQTVTQV